MLSAFLIWTAAVCTVDVNAVGAQETSIGFSTLNTYVHSLIGVNMPLYELTDIFSVIPLAIVVGFAFLGLFQWIKRKKLSRVDHSIIVLGGFYAVVFATFIFFEIAVVNYRPVLIDGALEASYPSSTTMLVMCVMPTASMQLNSRIKNSTLRRYLTVAIIVFTAFMVICRLVSGVHWITDIVGGALLSAFLVYVYRAVCLHLNTKMI